MVLVVAGVKVGCWWGGRVFWASGSLEICSGDTWIYTQSLAVAGVGSISSCGTALMQSLNRNITRNITEILQEVKQDEQKLYKGISVEFLNDFYCNFLFFGWMISFNIQNKRLTRLATTRLYDIISDFGWLFVLSSYDIFINWHFCLHFAIKY